jgi:hypothetical protein
LGALLAEYVSVQLIFDIYPVLTAEIILNERFALKSPACCLLHSASQYATITKHGGGRAPVN